MAKKLHNALHIKIGLSFCESNEAARFDTKSNPIQSIRIRIYDLWCVSILNMNVILNPDSSCWILICY